jgi:hypothetical protein
VIGAKPSTDGSEILRGLRRSFGQSIQGNRCFS